MQNTKKRSSPRVTKKCLGLTHELTIKSETVPIKQAPRLPLIITKIHKLLKVGFLREVKDPKWLARLWLSLELNTGRLLCGYCDIWRRHRARAFYTRLIIISELKDFPMQTGPGPLVIEDPPLGMSSLLMVISSHGKVRSRPWLPVRVRRLSAVPWVMLRVNCYGSYHFYANYACLKVVLCPSTVTTKLPHKSQTILSS